MPGVPHPIPYQGSKRRLAPAILAFVPQGTRRLIEPCGGSAALSLAALASGRVERVLIGDVLAPLVELWRAIAARPEAVARAYEALWRAGARAPVATYAAARARFNRSGDPTSLLYVLARCVKAAVRFNARGEFNQSADRRRLGARPPRMKREIAAASALLSGRASFHAGDLAALCARARPSDVVYLDPPYEGTSGGRDRRYAAGLNRERLVDVLARLRARRVPVLISLDGRRGEKRFGTALPAELGLLRFELEAGTSSQSTLLGRRERTVESLYVSPELAAAAALGGAAARMPMRNGTSASPVAVAATMNGAPGKWIGAPGREK